MIRKAITLLATLLVFSTTVNAKPYYGHQTQKYTQTYKTTYKQKPSYKKQATHKRHAKPVFYNPEKPISMLGIETGSGASSYAFGTVDAPWMRVAQKDVGARASDIGVRRSLWCAAAMNKWLKQAGYKGTGSDMASSFAKYGVATTARPGAIAVMSRGGGGGHVGIVLRDEGKHVLLLSGNHSNRVAVARYPKSLIYAYRLPTNSQTRFASLD